MNACPKCGAVLDIYHAVTGTRVFACGHVEGGPAAELLAQRDAAIDAIPLDKTCGELSCDECNDRTKALMARVKELEAEAASDAASDSDEVLVAEAQNAALDAQQRLIAAHGRIAELEGACDTQFNEAARIFSLLNESNARIATLSRNQCEAEPVPLEDIPHVDEPLYRKARA